MTSRAIPEDRKKQRARISHELQLEQFSQPDDVTCGPSCLLKVYRYFDLALPLETVLEEIDRNEDGGTLAVFLGVAGLRRGFRAKLYSYDLRIFDPTWRALDSKALGEKIRQRIPHLARTKARRSATAYLEFLKLGGDLEFEELTPALLKRILNRNHPVLAGLSATHLYGFSRERHDPVTHDLIDDDVAGDPIGHFVVITGYEHWGRRFVVRDPSAHIPATQDGRLVVDAHKLINSILLGDLTYDAVLLELWRPEEEGEA
ncbi:MAG: peptidase-C39 like family protein [Gemmatimonadota bacterium]